MPLKSALYVNGLLVLVLFAALEVLSLAGAPSLSGRWASIATLAKFAAKVAIMIWYACGTWRSSTRDRTTAGELWGLLARLFLLAMAGVQFAAAVREQRVLLDAAALAVGEPPLAAVREAEDIRQESAVGEPWSVVRRGLRPKVHESLTMHFTGIDLPQAGFERLEACEIERQVLVLKKSGCLPEERLNDFVQSAEMDQINACVERAVRAAERGEEALSCWRRHVPNDWTLHRTRVEDFLAARIDPEEPKSDLVREIAQCAVPRVFQLAEAASCRPRTAEATTVGEFLSINPCLSQQLAEHYEEVRRCGEEVRRTHSAGQGKGTGSATQPSGACAEPDGCRADAPAADFT